MPSREASFNDLKSRRGYSLQMGMQANKCSLAVQSGELAICRVSTTCGGIAEHSRFRCRNLFGRMDKIQYNRLCLPTG